MSEQASRQSELFLAEDWRSVFKAFTEVNFRSYSFDTIKSAMVDYIRNKYPEDFNEWTQNSEFIFIIDLLSYLGESLSYRVDLNARDNFIDTAERRESIIRLAKMLNYNPRRNYPARGLVKISSVRTNQTVIDSNGNDLANRTISWNDPNNPDWFEQFILVLNSSFTSTNQFGTPIKQASVTNIPSSIYKLNSVTRTTVADSFSSSVAGETMEFQIVNPDINEFNLFFERNPDPDAAKHIIYRNDGTGNSSPNTGFFFYFKEGNLRFDVFNFVDAVENRVVDINIPGINELDVWVQEINDEGNVIQDWTKVPAVENINFNSIGAENRTVFSVITRDNDQISIRFPDGRFGKVPVGIFRVWYRTSNGLSYIIRPTEIQGTSVTIPYFRNSLVGENQQFNLILSFDLQNSVTNSAPSETLEDIKRRAPRVFYTQNRMTNGEDYNSFPLLFGPQARKIKAINRTYAGHTRFLDLNDPTKTYQTTTDFGDDGVLYQEFYLGFDSETSLNVSISDIINRKIAPIFSQANMKNFYFSVTPRFVLSNLFWQQSTTTDFSSTGFFVNSLDVIQPVGKTVVGNRKYIRESSLVEFVDSNNSTNVVWGRIATVNGNGTIVLPSGVGAVRLDQDIENDFIAGKVLPGFRTVLSNSEFQNIEAALDNKSTFGIRYDFEIGEFKIIDTPFVELNTNLPFSLVNAGSTNPSAKDNSWLILVEYDNGVWNFVYRYLRYVFESVETSRFFFNPEFKAIDVQKNLVNFDFVRILKVNSEPNSANPLGKDYEFTLVDNFRYPDGFIEPRRVQISPKDSDQDGNLDNPELFSIIVDPDPSDINKFIIQKRQVDNFGYDFYQITNDVEKFSNLSSLLNVSNWSNPVINGSTGYNIGNKRFYQFRDYAGMGETGVSNVFQNIFTIGQNLSINGYNIVLTGTTFDSLFNQIESALNSNLIPNLNKIYYVNDNSAGLIYLVLENVDTVPISISGTASAVLGIINFIDISEEQDFLAFQGRENLAYMYKHFSPFDNRLDPSVTNVIDMYVLTEGYNNEVTTWKNSQLRGIFPKPPSSYDLKSQFGELEEYKMMTDEMIWNSAKFKILFGEGAEPELRAQFKVVKSSSTILTDNEIKQRVISAIDTFFDINNWDFGESFYFTELAAYIHQQLATVISSVVIVPIFSNNKFGDLFQVRSEFDELFVSTARVQDVVIIPAITESNIRVR